MSDKLSNLEIAIVTAHTMRRFLLNFKPHERTNAMDEVITRLRRFLLQREKANLGEFKYATDIEKAVYQNATLKFKGDTPIFAIDFSMRLYDYFEPQLKKYAKINPKTMEKIAIIMNRVDIDSSKCKELEDNGSDLLDEFIKEFEPLSGIGIKKSLFAGKRLTIKNNMIIEGKTIADGY